MGGGVLHSPALSPLKCSKLLDHTQYQYLDVVHLDIAFGNCLSGSGFRYALVFVHQDTQYNWAFGLKSLSLDCILLVICLFELLLVASFLLLLQL